MMKRKEFCCDANKDFYEQYYVNQSGSGIPVFYGALGQRGHGLGSMISGFFRRAFPFIFSGAKALGKQALKTGVNIANDVIDGKSLKESAGAHIPDGIKSFVSSNFGQSGSGKRRKRTSKRKTKRRKKDIFG